jgi:hypothetical protein
VRQRVAPDLDRLMWAIAEANDDRAASDFESRFPELRNELTKRIAMVRGLKVSKPHAEPVRQLPKFDLRPTPEPRISYRTGYVLACMAAAVVAFGSYVVTGSLLRSPDPAPLPLVLQEQPVDALSGFDPSGMAPMPAPSSSLGSTASGTQPPAPTLPVPRMQRPLTVRLNRVPLAVALEAVAGQVSATLEIAPGLPEIDVSLDYHGVGAIEIFKDLGRRYGFTAFDQGGGGILIVPAVDPRESASGDPSVGRRSNEEPTGDR